MNQKVEIPESLGRFLHEITRHATLRWSADVPWSSPGWGALVSEYVSTTNGKVAIIRAVYTDNRVRGWDAFLVSDEGEGGEGALTMARVLAYLGKTTRIGVER